MSYCQNCGSEVSGKFCANCGSPMNAIDANTGVSMLYGRAVRENTTVKPCYKVFHVILGAFMFLYGAAISALAIGTFFSFLFTDGFAFDIFVFCCAILVFGLFFLFIGYFPGIRHIRKNTPKEAVAKTIRTFVFKTIIGVPAFAVSFIGCAFIVGLILRVWRIAGKTFSPKPCNYVALVDGKSISVTRMVDTEFSSYDSIRYIYVDSVGNLYREPLFE